MNTNQEETIVTDSTRGLARHFIADVEPLALPPRAHNLLIDCNSCTARPVACGDCVVSALLGTEPELEQDPEGESATEFDLDPTEVAALAALAGSGLVPPLRLIT